MTQIYGERFVRYVLAIPEDASLDFSLSEEQSQVVIALYGYWKQTEGQADHIRWLNAAVQFLAFNEKLGHTIVNAMRVSCGGEIPDVQPTGDVLFDDARVLGRDYFAAFLMKRPESSINEDYPLSPELAGHPRGQKFPLKVINDPDAKKLFPGARDAAATDLRTLLQVQTFIAPISGGYYPLSLMSFGDLVLNAAFSRLTLSDSITCENYVQRVGEVIHEIRRLARGETVEVPGVTALSHVQMDDGVKISVDDFTVMRRPFNYGIGIHSERSTLLVSNISIKIMGVFEVDNSDSLSRLPDVTKFMGEAETWTKGLVSQINKVCLAFPLASEGESLCVAAPTGTAIHDPLMRWPRRTGRPFAGVGVSQTTVDKKLAEEVAKWIGAVLTLHPQSLDVAAKRIISAMGERADLADSLVDAVLAWENMFSGTPETMLRVCGALAYVLEPDSFSRRKQEFQELKSIYSTRSAIVHGKGKEPKMQTVHQHRNKAIQVALKALRVLYRNPELLKIRDSSARGTEVLLGGLRHS